MELSIKKALLNRQHFKGAASVIAMSAAMAFWAPAVRAANDCGVVAMGGTATCNAANEASSYQDADGITYQVKNLTIVHPGDGNQPTEFITSGSINDRGTLTITSTGAIHQHDLTSGYYGSGLALAGIYAATNSGSLTITNSSSIETESAGVEGIYAAGGRNGGSGNITVTNSLGASILTHENFAAGINARLFYGTGTVSVYNHGTITAQFASKGIDTYSSSGNIIVTSDGAITSNGAGIYSLTRAGSIDINNASTIDTTGAFAHGIFAYGRYGTGAYGIKITNSSAITTYGFRANGIQADLASNSPLRIISSGTIDVTYSGDGIRAFSSYSDIDIDVSGNITTNNGSGVIVIAGGGGGGLTYFGGPSIFATGDTVNVSLDNATIDATGGQNDAGINILVGNEGVTVDISSTGRIQTHGDVLGGPDGVFIATGGLGIVNHYGAIVADPDAGTGISLTGSYGSKYVVMTGSISTGNTYAHGINFRVSGHGDPVNYFEVASASLSGSSIIRTTGTVAHGIYMLGGVYGFVSLTGDSDILTTGSNSDAIHTETAYCSSISVAGQSKAVATGDGSAGIYLTVSNLNGGGFAPLDTASVAAAPSIAAAPTPACDTGYMGDILIDSNAVVSGGFEAAVGNRAAGIAIVDARLFFVTDPILVAIDNRGTLGALSDVAVLTDLDGGKIGIDMNNSGIMTGELRFHSNGRDNTVTNGGVWNIRGWGDSDGDGTRDLERIALNIFEGDNDFVINTATGRIALLSSPGTDVGGAGVEETELRGLEELINDGLIDMGDEFTGNGSAVAGDRFLLEGNLSGDGSVRIDTFLNNGGAGNQTTDRLLVQGDVDGTQTVFVRNAAGLGATTGLLANEGISIIQVTGQASAGSFVLGNTVVVGAYTYDLNAFGPGNSDLGELDSRLSGNEFWDFRLQNTGQIFAGVGHYPEILNAAGQLFWADLDVLHRRMGEIRPNLSAPLRYQLHEGQGQTAAMGIADSLEQEAVKVGRLTGRPEGAWGKAFGSQLAYDIGIDQDIYGLIGGYDWGYKDQFKPGDLLIVGPMAGFASSDVGFDGSDDDLDLASVRLGGYAVYFDEGFYLDGVAKVDYSWGTFVSPISNTDDDVALTTGGLSLETGYTIMVSDRAFIEPQGQISYSHTWGTDFQDGSGSNIALDGYDSLVGRLGLRVGANFAVGDRGRASPYLQAGVLHELLGDASAEVSGLTIDSSVTGTTYEVGGGIHAAQLASHTQAYFDILYRFGEMEGIKGVLGVRVSW